MCIPLHRKRYTNCPPSKYPPANSVPINDEKIHIINNKIENNTNEEKKHKLITKIITMITILVYNKNGSGSWQP